MWRTSLLRRLIVSLVVGTASSIPCAVVVAIVDLYLSGHDYDGLTREYATWSAAGFHLSIGDMIMLHTVLLAAALTRRLQASFR